MVSAQELAFRNEINHGVHPTNEVSVDQLRRVALHNAAEIDALVRKHRGNIRAGTPAEKLAEIRRINNNLLTGSGNIAAGQLVFDKRCASCHKLFNAGKGVGPDLTKANRGHREFLLVSMVDPNAQIRRQYLSYIVVTVNGRVKTGLLAEETVASITVIGAKNVRTTIARDDIDQIKVSPVLRMPGNILKELKTQQVLDLLQYLQSNGK